MTDALHVLVVDEFAGIGGAETVLLQLIDSLTGRFRFFSIISGEGLFSERLKASGVPVSFCPMQKLKKKWLSITFWQRETKVLTQVIQTLDPDIILVNSIWALCAMKFSLSRSSIPVVCAVHAAVSPKRRIKRTIFKLVTGIITRVPRLWITVSDELRVELEQLGIAGERIRIIPNGVDLSHFTPRKKTPGHIQDSHDEQIVIGTLGRLHPGKGQDTFVDMANRIAQKHQHVRFVIVGDEIASPAENLGFKDYLKRKIASYDLTDRIELTGFKADSADQLRGMDIFVSTSREESFGLAVLEAMACGLPVVSSKTGGLSQLVDNGRSGFLVQPGDSDAFAEKVDVILRDPAVRRKMGETGRKLAGQYDLNRTTQRWADCLVEAVQQTSEFVR
jgi:glycosyltransferase involved in cell wall biosynthesis